MGDHGAADRISRRIADRHQRRCAGTAISKDERDTADWLRCVSEPPPYR